MATTTSKGKHGQGLETIKGTEGQQSMRMPILEEF